MAASPVNFLFGFLLLSITLWLVFIFASGLLAWILSRILGASVGFRVGGWKCLRDVVVKFKKGAIESVSVGEIKLSLRQSLVKLGVGFISRDPKLQVLICDLEVVMRPSNKSPGKKKTRKSRASGRGKWMIVGNIARYLSVCVTDLVLKTPKFTVEIKELNVDISKDGGSKSNLLVGLQILPIFVHIGEPRVSCDFLSNLSGGGCSSSGQASITALERSSAPFICEMFSVSCEFGHDREVGIVIKNMDISSGEMTVNLNEELLLKSKSPSKSSPGSDSKAGSHADSASTKMPSKKQQTLAAFSKFSSMFPEKVSFNLPKLDVSFVHREHGLSVENNIMGIQLKSTKSRSTEDLGESTRLDFQLEFSEIHLLREAGSSILEILKLDLISFVYIPIQPISPVRAETEVKLGGTQCNIIMSRLKPWLFLHSSKKKKMVLQEEASVVARPQSTDGKTVMWTCNVSAPEMTIVLFNMAGSPVYHGCSQSSHLFANNISNMGTTVHTELGELNLHLADEYQECLKESVFGVESNCGSIMHIAKVNLDWGKKDVELSEEDGPRCRLGLSIDVTGMGVYITFKLVESLVSTAISFQALLKSLSASKKKSTHSQGRLTKSSGKGTHFLKFNLERCSVHVWGETGLENTIVPDPKRVNYGSQGGRVMLNVSADGTPRNANIMSTISDEYQKLKYSVSLEIFQFSLCVNKEKQSTQMELERARSVYQEYMEENRPVTNVALFDMQNAKFVQRSGGLKDIAVCSLFSATDITVRWEPDVHLSLVELVLQLKLLVHNSKLQEHGNEHMVDVSHVQDANWKKEVTIESGHLEKPKKKESIFAVDVEMLSISAGLGDGVDAMVQVQSIFSENARIGVLLEGLMLSFNGARIFKSSRMQISRIPSVSASTSDTKGHAVTTWDWVVQGLDFHICMPYRLQLRAIDDVIEDMLRGLKLIIAAKTSLIFPVKKESSKVKKPSTVQFGCIKFCIRKLTADIEEEPIQGWLDEHYQLLKKEAAELAARLNFLDEFISKAKQGSKSTDTVSSSQERKFSFNNVEVDVKDSSTIESMREDIYKRSFRSYYQACQNLVLSEGSGACVEDFQAGFRPSTSRTSLLSISALDLDVSLKKIDGGDFGMIEVLKKLDPVCLENDIPFSRLYGSNILLNTGSLVVQLRDYSFPLFSGSSGKCEGCLVLAQQATSFQPQMYQDVYVGRWRKVRMLRSASGTTPPLKTYSDLPIHFQKGEVSYGVGYEPAFADISYAFTVALRRANLSVRNPGPLILPPKKERSLPWWDDMRNYIHGKISLLFSESKWNVLASTDPYEKVDKLQIVTNSMDLHQSDGRVLVSAKDFKILLSSLESLANRHGFKIPTGVSGAFLEAPVFTLEVTMDWDCESGDPMNHYLFALPVEGKPRDKVFDPFRSTSLSLWWNFSLRPFPPPSQKQSSSSITRRDIEGDATAFDPSHISHNVSPVSPTFNFGAHDLAWILKFWSLNYIPPHKLRSFSRWPHFGIPRVARSGNLSLDKVMTEFMLRLDATPACIKNMPLDDDDPARGLTFAMTKLKYELCYSRGKQKYTFESKRDILDLVYQGLDLHMIKAFLNKKECASVAKVVNMILKSSQSLSMDKVSCKKGYMTEKNCDDGFLLSSDYFTIRRQSPKADPARLLAWQEAGRRTIEMAYVRSEYDNGSETDDHMRSDPSDDEGYNVVVADDCQSVFVYGLKLLWTIGNRDAVWAWVGGLSKAFEPPKPSPSQQYAQRKLLEEKKLRDGADFHQDDVSKCPPTGKISKSPSLQQLSTPGSVSSSPNSVKVDNLPSVKKENMDGSGGTRRLMVNVIEPQFNLHSEDANVSLKICAPFKTENLTFVQHLQVQGLKRELVIAQISRKAASASLRTALQKAAQLRLTEKEKNKSPSYAMRISLQINRVAWSMLVDGKSFAEAEINDMIYDFDRDYKDVGIARFTTKYFVVRNCLPNVKSDMLLSAWNPPSEWGKKVMLRVDARQGAPKDGNSPLELFEIEIYPLKIHLTETMYRMMWEYFFPEEEQDSQRRQEVWKVSTTAGARRVKKGSSVLEASASNSHTTKESEASSKSGISAMLFPTSSQPPAHVDSAQASKTQNVKANPGNGATPELRRTSSFDRTWEETVAESVANELVLQSFSSSKNGQFGSTEQQDEAAKNNSKGVKGGRSSHEEKKVAKSHEEKRSRPRKMMEFHNIKISQVELLVTYEGQRFVVNDLKLLMDQFHRTEFTGTWRRLFSRVKKHIIWGVLKSVTGMQGRKFNRPTGAGVPEIDLILSDNEGQAGKSDQYPPSWPKRPSDGAGDGFVTSIRGLFSTQRRKAKAFVLRTMRGEAENDFQGDWSESDMDFSPFARQLTITRAKKLIRRHTKKFRSRGQKASQLSRQKACYGGRFELPNVFVEEELQRLGLARKYARKLKVLFLL
ncbi:UPF0378 protein KIAA0100-like protein [Glycine soja]|nr:UPF0378 protein KIAA0100-like protein [Glycine soja]